jgi:hypothetical protein
MREGHHHVAVLLRRLADLLVRDAAPAELRFAVHGEHHQADLLLAVVGHRLLDRRPAVAAEVLVGRAVVLLAVVVERVPARHLGVGVDVDGDQVGGLHAAFLFGSEVDWSGLVSGHRILRAAGFALRVCLS